MRARSIASERVIPTIACFAAQYADVTRSPRRRCSTKTSTQACPTLPRPSRHEHAGTRNGEVVSSSTIRSPSVGGAIERRAPAIPVLSTSTSTVPTDAIAASSPRGRADRPSATRPTSSRSRRGRACCAAHDHARHWIGASVLAIAAPMPRPPPVTSASCSSRIRDHRRGPDHRVRAAAARPPRRLRALGHRRRPRVVASIVARHRPRRAVRNRRVGGRQRRCRDRALARKREAPAIDGRARAEGEALTWSLAERGRSTPCPARDAWCWLHGASRSVAVFIRALDPWWTPTITEPPVPLALFRSPPMIRRRGVRVRAPFGTRRNSRCARCRVRNAAGPPIGVRSSATAYGREDLAADLHPANEAVQRRSPHNDAPITQALPSVWRRVAVHDRSRAGHRARGTCHCTGAEPSAVVASEITP